MNKEWRPIPPTTVRLLRVVVVIVLAVSLVMVAVLLLPGEPCMEWDEWRWVKIWPRPGHCP